MYAFSHSWSQESFYAFPPFSMIFHYLKKIEMDKGGGIVIVPLWPTQPWYPKLMRLPVGGHTTAVTSNNRDTVSS